MSERSVQGWTKDARKYEKEQQQAWDLRLDCELTQAEIGDKLGESQQTINNWVQKRERDSQLCEPPGRTSENPWGRVQHFDVWQFQTATSDAGTGSYFGKMPPQVVENLLWFYTEPGGGAFTQTSRGAIRSGGTLTLSHGGT